MEPLNAGEWAEFMLVVRNVSGSVDQWMYEWELNHKYNQKFGKKFKERQIGNDIIRGPPASPIPPIAYFIIKRTEEGMFYLETEQVFSSIDLLLSHYYTNALPINGDKDSSKQSFSLVLRGISQFYMPSYTFPRPMLGAMKKPTYSKKDRSPIQLFVGGAQKSLRDFRARIAKRVIFVDNEQKEALFRGYLYYNGTYNSVTIRKLRPKLFNQKAFNKDVQKQDTNVNKIRNGYEFLSHIVGFGNDPEEKFGNWIAYEYVTGTPLDRFLQRRKYMNEFMLLREKSEILYQVSAGMRFLELNGLCHRHLRGSNIIVHEEGSHIYAVKITDYMVTYHFLDEEAVELINMSDLDWPWWAPECVLYRCFDIVSDVWAFGCVIFEINHDGLGPYAFQKRRPQSHHESVNLPIVYIKTDLKAPPHLGIVFEVSTLNESPVAADQDGICDSVQNRRKPCFRYPILEDLQAIFEKGEQMDIIREDDTETFLDELLYMCIRYNPDARPTFNHLFNFFRDLLFDFAEGPEVAINKYIKKAPKKFEHPPRSSLIPEVIFQTTR
ncbi:hypothetical protein Y032_0665g1329 [Ancylostoma ceylanicum]|nr:hypothetical protein Y032_0665g1329 [Ancylostoma ceylanicum]